MSSAATSMYSMLACPRCVTALARPLVLVQQRDHYGSSARYLALSRRARSRVRVRSKGELLGVRD